MTFLSSCSFNASLQIFLQGNQLNNVNVEDLTLTASFSSTYLQASLIASYRKPEWSTKWGDKFATYIQIPIQQAIILYIWLQQLYIHELQERTIGIKMLTRYPLIIEVGWILFLTRSLALCAKYKKLPDHIIRYHTVQNA